MKILVLLTWSQMRLHWARLLLTVIAIGAAAGAVVCTYGSYSTKRAQTGRHAQTVLGSFSHWVTCSDPYLGFRQRSKTPPGAKVSDSIIKKISADSRVSLFSPVYQANLLALSRDSKRSMKRSGPPFRPLTAAILQKDSPFPSESLSGRWLDQSTDGAKEAVLLGSVADALDIQVGESVYLTGTAGEVPIEVVGIVPCPLARWDMPRGVPGIYITYPAMRAVLGRDDAVLPVNAAYFRVEAGDESEFATEYEKFADGKSLWLCSRSTLAEHMASGRSPFDMQAQYIIGLAFLGALLVIFTTLNISFGERSRQFALLRAVGASRWKIAMLIFMEAVVFSALGFVASIPLGWLILRIMVASKPELFPMGVALDSVAIELAALVAVCGALVASVIPIYFSLRLKPVDAMSQNLAMVTPKSRWWLTVVGAMLLVPSFLIAYVLDVSPAKIVFFMSAVGMPSLALGIILLIPATMRLVENVFAPVLIRVFGVPHNLYSQNLSRNTWRTLGVVISITIGLGIYSALKTWGYTMLKPFQPTDKLPDMIMAFRPDGLDAENAGKVKDVKGLYPDRCLPLVLRQNFFGKPALDNMTRIWGNDEGPNPRGRGGRPNVLVVGMDIAKAFGEEEPVLGFGFNDISRAEVVEKMAKGGYCIIPQSLSNLTGISVGDKFPVSLLAARVARGGGGRKGGRGGKGRAGAAPLKSTKSVSKSAVADAYEKAGHVDFTVAAVHSEPWHLISGWSGMRGLDGVTYSCNGMIFVNSEDAQKLPGNDRTVYYWARLSDEYRAMPVSEASIKIRDECEKIAAAQKPHMYHPFGKPEPVFVKMPQVNVISKQFLMNSCRTHANNIISRLSQLPIFALLISSLAIANTIMASVRARKWELGVLRSLGLTRMSLLRLLIVEALLIAITATIVSLGFGIIAGACVASIAQVSAWTRGLPIELVIPWAHLAVGVLITFGVTLAATAWPAISVSRRKPLDLLQEGRSTM